MVKDLPPDKTRDVLCQQLLRCGTSVGANYRAACRAKSTADFIAKMKIVEEEADEAIFWLELLAESKILHSSKQIESLKSEANELTAIAVASVKTARLRASRNIRPSSFVNRQLSGGVTRVDKGDRL